VFDGSGLEPFNSGSAVPSRAAATSAARVAVASGSSSNSSLLAAARATQMELDELEDAAESRTKSMATADLSPYAQPAALAATAPVAGKNLFRAPLNVTRAPVGFVARPSAAAAAESLDGDSAAFESGFDRRIEALLTRSAGPPVVGRTSSVGGRAGGTEQQTASSSFIGGASAVLERADILLDSSRSSSSAVSNSSLTSAASYLPSRSATVTGPSSTSWAAQHAHPSVGLAAAHAQRREMHAAQAQRDAHSR